MVTKMQIAIRKPLKEILENLVEFKQEIFVICFKISISNGDFSEMTRISQEIFGKMTLNYQAVKTKNMVKTKKIVLVLSFNV